MSQHLGKADTKAGFPLLVARGARALILSAAVLSAACETISNPVGPTPTPQVPRPGPAPGPVVQTLDRVIELASSDIRSYWLRMWPQAGVPNIRRILVTTPSGCAPVDASGPGAYCPPDRTVYLSDPVLRQLMDQFGDFAVVTVMAHEWGHHVQASFGRPGGTPAFELQADCFAGAYATDAYYRGLLDPGDAEEALRISWSAGGVTHGSPAQRVAAFQFGANYGPNSCLANF
jgi:hypothetical protein